MNDKRNPPGGHYDNYSGKWIPDGSQFERRLSVKEAKKALKLARKREEQRRRDEKQKRRDARRRQQDRDLGRKALHAVAVDDRPQTAKARVEAARLLLYTS